MIKDLAPVSKSAPRATVSRPRPKNWRLVAVCVALVALIVVINRSHHPVPHQASSKSLVTQNGHPVALPDFKIDLPDGQPIGGDNASLNYDSTKRVASFPDKIGSTSITVSEQQLPQDFNSDPTAGLERVAKSLNATVILSSTTPAYLANSVSGAQTVVLQEDGLLIFLYSSQKMDNTVWTNYVSKLR